MSDDLYRLMYTSRATQPWSGEDLQALLALSRSRNAEAGITGLLLYQSGHFAQVLEGPEPAVRALFATICADPRHMDVDQVLAGYAGRRDFASWFMGFQDLDEVQDRDFEPIERLIWKHARRPDPGVAYQYLLRFREGLA